MKGQRIMDAFVLFEGGAGIGQAAKRMRVTYATARVWWFQWRIAVLDELVHSLAERVAVQSEILSRRAEK